MIDMDTFLKALMDNQCRAIRLRPYVFTDIRKYIVGDSLYFVSDAQEWVLADIDRDITLVKNHVGKTNYEKILYRADMVRTYFDKYRQNSDYLKPSMNYNFVSLFPITTFDWAASRGLLTELVSFNRQMQVKWGGDYDRPLWFVDAFGKQFIPDSKHNYFATFYAPKSGKVYALPS